MKLEDNLNVFIATTSIFAVELLFSVLLLSQLGENSPARGVPIGTMVMNSIFLLASILCGAIAYRRMRQVAMLAQVPVEAEYTP